jgi:pimeloyl-ACP methyl ester carboxylesterase
MEGAKAYARDIPGTETHLLEAGHFALEEEIPRIAELILDFLDQRVLNETPR